MKITSKIQHASVKIYVNDILHIHFARDKFVSVQAWQYETENIFYIEITLSGGVMTCDYDKKEMWVGILKELDNLR